MIILTAVNLAFHLDIETEESKRRISGMAA